MSDAFERGKTWFVYSQLEREFIETTPHVALVTDHDNVWSEKFAGLLVRTGGFVDSFFRTMINSQSLINETTVKNLRKIRQPNIEDFRNAFEPIFKLSGVEVEAAYGLTYYGILQPFKDFDKKSPDWWKPYNDVKHDFFERIDKGANLKNTINALAGLFVLNILHKESQQYLISYTDIFAGLHLNKKDIENALRDSFVGKLKSYSKSRIVAITPLFLHPFRCDIK